MCRICCGVVQFVMTLALFLITLILGIVIISTDYQQETSKWLAAILFTTSIGAFANELEDTILPLLNYLFGLSEVMIAHFKYMNAFLTQFSEHLLSYLFLMYAISSFEKFTARQKKYATILLFIIPLISFLCLPVMRNLEKKRQNLYEYYYGVLTIWSVPYIIFGIIILIASYTNEKRVAQKKHKRISLIIIIPIAVSIIINVLILRAMGIREAWRINSLIVIVLFLIFLIFAFKYGVMGIKLRSERQNFLINLNAISQGTALFNHTLKNEVTKISMSSNNLRYSLDGDSLDLENALTSLDIIDYSLEYLQAMTKRIHEFAEDIKLIGSKNLLSDLVAKAVLNQKLIIDKKSISIEEYYNYNIYINCDREFITEVMINVIKNACEAVDHGGNIKIQLVGTPKRLSLLITDNGPGISNEYLSRIFEPFFTTKKTHESFGLGLSFCYKVMQKHGGDIQISSIEGVGTTVKLMFPSFRIVTFDNNLSDME